MSSKSERPLPSLFLFLIGDFRVEEESEWAEEMERRSSEGPERDLDRSRVEVSLTACRDEGWSLVGKGDSEREAKGLMA